MGSDIYYPEKVFHESFTFGNWLPLICTDVFHLQTFKEVYGRESLPKYTIYKSNGPFFFRNHPINYVVVTGKCINGYEVYIDNSKTEIVLILFLDDSSGQSLKCSKFSYRSAYKLQELVGKTLEVQGYIVDHPTFGREVRILQFRVVESMATEIENWADALKLRKEVLSKHWSYDRKDKQSALAVTSIRQSSAPNNTQEEENINRLGSLAPIDHMPTAFCSFMRPNAILSQENSIIENKSGITLNRNAIKCPNSIQADLFVNLNRIYYNESYREFTPELHDRILLNTTRRGKVRKLRSHSKLKFTKAKPNKTTMKRIPDEK
jgi:hypothetical protein